MGGGLALVGQADAWGLLLRRPDGQRPIGLDKHTIGSGALWAQLARRSRMARERERVIFSTATPVPSLPPPQSVTTARFGTDIVLQGLFKLAHSLVALRRKLRR